MAGSSAAAAIALDDSDEEDGSVRAPATARGAERAVAASAAVVVLSDGEDDEAVPAMPVASASAAGTSASAALPGVVTILDDDDDGAGSDMAARQQKRQRLNAAACKLCEGPQLRQPYKLAECGHSFCRACLEAYIAKRLRRVLPSEVACPTCAKGLTIHDVQTLGPATERGAAVPPPPSSGMPAFLVAQLRQRGIDPAAFGLGPSHAGSSSGGGTAAFERQRPVGTSVATKRLMKELQEMRKGERAAGGGHGMSVSLPDEGDLYTWDVAFFGFERGSPLEQDLRRVPGGRIELRVAFPSAYPSQPPYVRVVRPRFVYRTGHVTIGGSICTEVLTSAGWSSTMTIESVLIGIRTNMLVGGARLDPRNKHDYSEMEAREAFNRMVREHGWF